MLLAVVRALKRANVQTDGPVTFVADVGEEGLGDLRGMKQLFGETMNGRIDRFLAIDGTGLFLVNSAVGSRRYRVTFKGPGGHSYAAFGTANPIQAMGRAIAKISQLQPPDAPHSGRTTFNVGRVGGGTSVNAIPVECWMEIDLRSTDAAAIDALDASVQRAVDEAVREENQRGAGPRRDHVGPANSSATARRGRRRSNRQVVRTALAAARALGITLTPTESSTDANVPIQLKIPAITIGDRRPGHRYAYGRGDLRHDRRVEGNSVRRAGDDRARTPLRLGQVVWWGRSGLVGQARRTCAPVLELREAREIGGTLPGRDVPRPSGRAR